MKEKTGRVLLIEDNVGDARLLAEVLKDVPGQPFELVHADLVSSALDQLTREHFEAILLDLSLPDGQGFGVLRRLLDVAPSIPVLVLTGLKDEQMALNALAAGAQDYLVKGSQDGAFIARAIRYAIQRKELLERARALREIDQAITSTLDIQEILTALLDKTGALFPFSAACVQKINLDNGALESVALGRMHEKDLKNYDWSRLGGAVRPDTPVALARSTNDSATEAWDAVVAFPLKLKELIWGYLCFFSKKEREFGAEELDFLSALAAQVAVAIHNAELYAGTVALAEDLRRSNKVKDDFLSIMSHELRTPLNIVMNCAEIMRTGIVGEINSEQADILDRLMTQARNQLTLVNGILHATRMETEQLTASLEEVDLREFLENLKSDYAISFSNKNVELRWEHATDFPLARLDRDKLRHILENLLNNAIKFTAAGSIIVSARLVEGNAQLSTAVNQSRWLELAVADTGIGMPAQSLALIFEKFCQLDATSTRLHGGVGIGLYLVKRFATVLGGDVTVESQVGRGSTFTVTIPFIPAGLVTHQGSNAQDPQTNHNLVSSRPEPPSAHRLTGTR
ncbi:MAG TPA: ATP-binding protein [Candidatus Binatia bacterium]|jgi:signal transduction histidine kinase/DNA-binding NarL/FixJ family response regulator